MRVGRQGPRAASDTGAPRTLTATSAAAATGIRAIRSAVVTVRRAAVSSAAPIPVRQGCGSREERARSPAGTSRPGGRKGPAGPVADSPGPADAAGSAR